MMKYGSMSVNLSKRGANETIVQNLDFDTYDIGTIFKKDAILKGIVFDETNKCESTNKIKSICIIKKTKPIWGSENMLYLSYYNKEDTTEFEILMELVDVLRELGWGYE